MTADREQDDRTASSVDGLDVEGLEQVLVDLLIVKYPGIEQQDIDRMFWALDVGAMDQVEEIEADMAVKSARWRLAALDVDDDPGDPESSLVEQG
jgi:hypothetical protein